MSNYYLNASITSRNGKCLTSAVSYIAGINLHDSYTGKTCYNKRNDVEYCKILLPEVAPARFNDIQTLCNEIENAEIRKDACTSRTFIGSLPNELPSNELITIVNKFITKNFVDYGLCAIVAIHNGINESDPSKNNPHAHMIVSTRIVDSSGFSRLKFREHNKREYIKLWRESWAELQNEAYNRNGCDITVSHKSLVEQGLERTPTIHLSLADWQKELRGERTKDGNYNRKVREHNAEIERQRYMEHFLNCDKDMDFSV